MTLCTSISFFFSKKSVQLPIRSIGTAQSGLSAHREASETRHHHRAYVGSSLPGSWSKSEVQRVSETQLEMPDGLRSPPRTCPALGRAQLAVEITLRCVRVCCQVLVSHTLVRPMWMESCCCVPEKTRKRLTQSSPRQDGATLLFWWWKQEAGGAKKRWTSQDRWFSRRPVECLSACSSLRRWRGRGGGRACCPPHVLCRLRLRWWNRRTVVTHGDGQAVLGGQDPQWLWLPSMRVCFFD